MENFAEDLIFYLPEYLNDYQIANCSVLLFLSMPNKTPNIIQLEPLEEMRNSFLQYRIPIDKDFTCIPGTIKLWLNILHYEKQVIIKSDYLSFDVYEHEASESYIPSQSIDLLDQWQMKMDEISTKASESALVAEQSSDECKNILGNVNSMFADIKAYKEYIQALVESIKSYADLITKQNVLYY